MILLTLLIGVSHVPSYPGFRGVECVDRCCKLPHKSDRSQVLYLDERGGGYEVTVPHGENEIVIDATFKDKTPTSSYKLYYGCGDCKTSIKKLKEYIPGDYQNARVEPFTQTAYRSIIDKNGTLPNACKTNQKFTLRMVIEKNNTNKFKWGAVIGTREVFTFEEIVLFPFYIYFNHGSYWNEMPHTLWIWAGGSVALVFVISYWMEHFTAARSYSIFHGREKWIREYLYQIALFAFVAVAGEVATHLGIAEKHAGNNTGVIGGFFYMVLVAQGLGILFTLVSWHGLILWKEGRKSWISSPWWAIIEVATGLSFFFLLGSGFFVGPFAITLAGFVRFGDFERQKRELIEEEQQYYTRNPVYREPLPSKKSYFSIPQDEPFMQEPGINLKSLVW